MAEVVLPLRFVTEKGLPSICAVTGERADGAVSLRLDRSWKRWSSPTVKVPLSDPIFRKWSTRQNVYIKARALASVLTAVGIVIAFRNGLLGLAVVAVALAVHLVDLWADRTTSDFQPVLERRGQDLALLGVHQHFADAVGEMVHD